MDLAVDDEPLFSLSFDKTFFVCFYLLFNQKGFSDFPPKQHFRSESEFDKMPGACFNRVSFTHKLNHIDFKLNFCYQFTFDFRPIRELIICLNFLARKLIENSFGIQTSDDEYIDFDVNFTVTVR